MAAEHDNLALLVRQIYTLYKKRLYILQLHLPIEIITSFCVTNHHTHKACSGFPPGTKRCRYIGLMLGHRLRRWLDIKPT